MSPKKDLAHYARIAAWMEKPRLPGSEREFQTWIAQSEENGLEWQQWQHLLAKAKRLQFDPLDIDGAWVSLRSGIGLRRQKAKSPRGSDRLLSTSGISRIFRRPIVVALLSMVALSLFFLALYLIRARAGF